MVKNINVRCVDINVRCVAGLRYTFFVTFPRLSDSFHYFRQNPTKSDKVRHNSTKFDKVRQVRQNPTKSDKV